MPKEKNKGIDQLYMNDTESDLESPAGLENASDKKPKWINRPRSNRIILVVALAFLCLMIVVLFNIIQTPPESGSRKKQDADGTSRELSSEFISSVVNDLNASNDKQVPGKEEEEFVLTDDGLLIPANKAEHTAPAATDINVVYAQPTQEYGMAKDMFVQGLFSDTTVEHATVNASTTQSVAEEGNIENCAFDPEYAYNAGMQDGALRNESDADKNVRFLSSSQQEGAMAADEYIPNTRRHQLTRYELKAGTIINAVMMSGINSDLPGTILGQVSENIYDTATGGHLLIPQGSRIIGTYNSHIIFGQQRVLVVWNRIIYPDGSSLNIGGMPGSDQAGYSGMKQYVNNHYGRLIGAAVFSSVFVALGKEATKNDKKDDGSNSSTAEAVMEQMTSFGTRLAERNLNISPTLMIKPGRRFTIITTKDVAFQETYKM